MYVDVMVRLVLISSTAARRRCALKLEVVRLTVGYPHSFPTKIARQFCDRCIDLWVVFHDDQASITHSHIIATTAVHRMYSSIELPYRSNNGLQAVCTKRYIWRQQY